VKVGDGGLTFTPSNVKANPGDKIVFEFIAKNHTVTQSSFESPCSPLAQSGFDSGYQFIAAGSSPSRYEITVNDTRPIWAYCAQGTHCSSGMVFAVNPAETGERTFTAFENLAKNAQGGGGGGYGSPADGGSSVSVRTSFFGAAMALLAAVALV
jgi:plastocyanin